MPTGSGKSAVITTLARCFNKPGPVVVLTPRVGLREQLKWDIDARFLEHAQVAASLPRRVIELDEGSSALGDLRDAILVCTPQMLSSLKRRGNSLFTQLKRTTRLLLFDEGHYEPARIWRQAVRELRCPRIVFTATPFRDDFKLFEIEDAHWFHYTYAEALLDGFVRSVEVHSRPDLVSPARFVDDVVAQYDILFGSPSESLRDRPRAIIRCDRSEHVRQLVAALTALGRSAVGIHETFVDSPTKGEYHRVPKKPELLDKTFWVHQFKLLEGIDDPRFRLLALYGELRSVRALVQQVGRVIRKSRHAPATTAYVLDHSPRQTQRQLWNQFLDYDRRLASGDTSLDLNRDTLIEQLRDAVPGLIYRDGRFRAPADFRALGVDDLVLPLSANVFERPTGFSPTELFEAMKEEAEDCDLILQRASIDATSLVAFQMSFEGSPLLGTRFLVQPSLGVSVVRASANHLFVFESGTALVRRVLTANPVEPGMLFKLYAQKEGARLSSVSVDNANPGADQVRARSVTARQVDALVPIFDESSYVLRRATGYGAGSLGLETEEVLVRRYVGIDNGRISDEAEPVSYQEWSRWTQEIESRMSGTQQPLRVFQRWARASPRPADQTPKNVLIDLGDADTRFRVIGSDEPIEIRDLCSDVDPKGNFQLVANDSPVSATLEFDADNDRYVLSSRDLDERYYSRDQNQKEGLVQHLNKTQSYRVIPATHGYVYALGRFWEPQIQFGPKYDDDRVGLLSCMHSSPNLRRVTSEKGGRCEATGANWERGCLFDLVDTLGKGTDLEPHFDGTEVMVCDDEGHESADFILVQEANAARPRKRVVFIHGKASKHKHSISASSLQDVCGQAQKNLREVSLFADPVRSKVSKWSKSWTGAPHTEGIVKHRLRRGSSAAKAEELIRRTVKDPSADREVWLMLGNLLSKAALEAELKGRPQAHAIQVAYLLQSTIVNTAAAGARLVVYCG